MSVLSADVIVELSPEGKVVDEWRLFHILDRIRDIVIKSLDRRRSLPEP